MGDFAYQAIDKTGRRKKGSMKAESAAQVMEALRSDGLTPVKVTEQNLLTRDINIGGEKKVKTRDLAVFCRQFSGILKASVTVVDGLKLMSDQTEHKTLKNALDKTLAAVKQGNSLADSMRLSPKVFPPMLVNMIEAGEASGTLDTCIERMGIQYEKSARIQGLVKKAMTYPIVVVIVAFAVMIVMSMVIVPKFAVMFAELGADLPVTTRMVMGFSDFLFGYWWLLLILIVGLVLGINLVNRTDAGKMFFGRMALRLPIFGKFNMKSSSASFARTMSTLMASGMGITQAIDIAANAMSNICYTRLLKRAKSEVEQGYPLSQPLRQSDIFPPMVYNMMAIGEETGDVSGMLDRVADYYEEETELAAASMTELLQPLIIVVVGGMVAILVLAMYQPMIEMYGTLG